MGMELNQHFVRRQPPAVALVMEPGASTPPTFQPVLPTAPTTVPRTRWHARLRPLNALLFLVHAAAAGTVLVLADTDVTEQLYRGSISSQVTTDASNETSVSLAPGPAVEFFKLDVAFYTLAFFAVTAFFHARAALAHEAYVLELLECRNAFRWVEYAVSASIMATTVAYFCTIYDGFQLIALAALTATTMGHGYLAELQARPADALTWKVGLSTRLAPHVLGYLPQAAAWLIILWPFYLNTVDTEMPRFVYGIVAGQFVVFWSFGLIQLVVLCNRPRSYVYGEIAYVALSAAGKLLLGAQLLFNVIWSRG